MTCGRDRQVVDPSGAGRNIGVWLPVRHELRRFRADDVLILAEERDRRQGRTSAFAVHCECADRR